MGGWGSAPPGVTVVGERHWSMPGIEFYQRPAQISTIPARSYVTLGPNHPPFVVPAQPYPLTGGWMVIVPWWAPMLAFAIPPVLWMLPPLAPTPADAAGEPQPLRGVRL